MLDDTQGGEPTEDEVEDGDNGRDAFRDGETRMMVLKEKGSWWRGLWHRWR